MEFSLSSENIDLFSERQIEFQKQLNMKHADSVRACYLMEDILVSLSRFHGEDAVVTAFFDNRLLGGARIRLELKGERYNPLSTTETDEDDWMQDFFRQASLHPQYAYIVDKSYLTLKLPKIPMNPVLKIAIAIVVGTILGLLGNTPLLSPACDVISRVVLTPLYDAWIRVLTAISGPIIFFTAVITTLNAKSVTDQGGSVLALVMRYFLLTLLVLGIAAPFCWLVFPLDIGHATFSLELVETTLDDLFSVIPDNLLGPFATANTPQLLLCALVLGNVLLHLGDKMSNFTHFVRQINEVGLTIAQWVSEFVPYFAVVFLCLGYWNDSYGLFLNLWKPLLLAILIAVVALVVFMLVVSAFQKVRPQTLMLKLHIMAEPAFREGSINYSLDELAEICEKWLGVAGNYSKAALPKGLNLYTPISAMGAFVCMVFVAYAQQVPVDTVWILRVIVIAAALFAATPPVTGANLLAYVAFFPVLGLADDALMVAVIFDIVFSVFANGVNLSMLQLETVMQASYTGFLDVEVLRAPAKR